MSGAYYNEIDPLAAEAIRGLMAAGFIAEGELDERSIEQVEPADLRGFTQCHFFAGIGVWSYALRRAGWPDDRSVWTGSCPCQPFSSAGMARGFADERHLWPAFHHLISQCQPPVVFGEQVASADGLTWLDLVSADLEGSAYAVGAADLCAAGVGAPHIRQRLYWVGNASRTGLAQQRSDGTTSRKATPGEARQAIERADASTPWGKLEWLQCTDGKARPTQPGIQPLAHGFSNRVGALRGAGNAIVPQAAAEVIAAFMERA